MKKYIPYKYKGNSQLSIFNFKFVLFLFLIPYSLCLFGQQHKIDSLRNALKTEQEDTNKVNALNALSERLWRMGIYDSALNNANNAQKLADKLGFKKGTASAITNIGIVYEYEGDYTKSLECYTKALDIDNEIGDKSGIGRNLANIGVIYKEQGNYPKALEYELKSLGIEKEIGAEKGVAINYCNIGNIYDRQGNYAEALENYSKALEMDKKIGYRNGVAINLGNMGNIYVEQGDYKQALEYYLKTISIEQEIGDQSGIARNMGNIGDIYVERVNKELVKNKNGKYDSLYEKAIKYEQGALVIEREIGDKSGVSRNMGNIGNILTSQKKYSEARMYLDSSITLAKGTGEKSVIENSYAFRAILDSATGNYKAALEDYENYTVYKDSLINEDNIKKSVQAQMNYDFEQKENTLKAEQDKQNALSEEKLKRQKVITWGGGAALVVVLVFSWLMFNRNRLKQKTIYQQELNLKQKEQATAVMETQEQERKRIAEDLHDSIGHLLSATKLNLQATSGSAATNVENSLQLLDTASNEMRNITFNLMPRTLEEEGLIPALHEMVARIKKSGSVNILLHVHEDVVLEKQAQFTVYRIIQEAVNNILKHAESNEINIQLMKQENMLVIMIEDDGKGFDVTGIKKGRGLQNMISRCEWLNGKLAIDSSPGSGTTITIEIPV